MAVLANKQSELEKMIKFLIKQNDKFQKDNRILWSELIKNKQKTDNQQERVLMWFLQQFAQKNSKAKQTKNGQMLMLKGEDGHISEPYSQPENNFAKIQTTQEDDSIFDQALEGLSRKQILQGLLQSLNIQRTNKKTIKNLLIKQLEEDISSESDREIPKQMKKIKYEQPPENESQVRLYSENFNSHKSRFPQYPSIQGISTFGQTPMLSKKQSKQEKTEPSNLDYHLPYPQNNFDYGSEYLNQDIFSTDRLVRKDSLSYAVDQNISGGW